MNHLQYRLGGGTRRHAHEDITHRGVGILESGADYGV
jgi:hypothetical protein